MSRLMVMRSLLDWGSAMDPWCPAPVGGTGAAKVVNPSSVVLTGENLHSPIQGEGL
jgi:hypothetical protein